jgi:hypothetical protein
MAKTKNTCSNCGNQPICMINEGAWKFYRDSVQGTVYTPVDCFMAMNDILAKHCKHWREINDLEADND